MADWGTDICRYSPYRFNTGGPGFGNAGRHCRKTPENRQHSQGEQERGEPGLLEDAVTDYKGLIPVKLCLQMEVQNQLTEKPEDCEGKECWQAEEETQMICSFG